jgi:streptogramin lyase
VIGARPAAALAGLVAIVCLADAAAAPAAAGRGPEYSLGQGMHASALAVGPDRNIWFAGTRYSPGQSVDVVGWSTADGQIAEFALPACGEAELGISSITAGADGNLYFTEPNANRIGRVSTAGEISELDLPNPGSRPRTIVAAPDGGLWFTEEGGDRVGRLSPVTSFLRERQLTPGARPTGIAARADGTIWIAEPGVDGLAIVTAAGISTFRIPFDSPGLNAIVPGPEGNVWFTEENGPWLGRITSAALTKADYERLELQIRQGTRWLAFGPSGDFWFTTGNHIGSISPDKLGSEPACLAAGCDLPVTALAAGPEGGLWYATGTEQAGALLAPGTIGRFLPPRIMATVNRRTGRLAGRYVKLGIACQGGAAGQFCRGQVRIRGRLGGNGSTALLGSRGLEFHVYSSRSFRVQLSRPAATLLKREGQLSARVSVSLSGGRRTSRQLVLRASGRAHGPAHG